MLQGTKWQAHNSTGLALMVHKHSSSSVLPDKLLVKLLQVLQIVCEHKVNQWKPVCWKCMEEGICNWFNYRILQRFKLSFSKLCIHKPQDCWGKISQDRSREHWFLGKRTCTHSHWFKYTIWKLVTRWQSCDFPMLVRAMTKEVRDAQRILAQVG